MGDELQKSGPEFACLLSNSVGNPSLSGLHTSGYAKLVSGHAGAQSPAVCDQDLWFVQTRLSTVVGIPTGGTGRGTILHSPRIRGDRNVVSKGFPPPKVGTLVIGSIYVFVVSLDSHLMGWYLGIGQDGESG